jgi:hypothetical protein
MIGIEALFDTKYCKVTCFLLLPSATGYRHSVSFFTY